MSQIDRFTKVEFTRFKAFRNFSVNLKRFNILAGPNNSGKSTILAAFRILAAAMRRANTRNAELIRGPEGTVRGYPVDLKAISVAEENIFYNYDDDEPALVKFILSNGNTLTLFFPERGVCNLVVDAVQGQVLGPGAFRSRFRCPIGFVPILGPVEHNEPLFEKEAARLALFNYRAARNFRNIWYHYPELFDEFRSSLKNTWPGMDIERPEIDTSHSKPTLFMYCPEDRRPREIYWAGFGFQVWCQMLTHVIQSRSSAIFLIDEPDIYLHSDLQRQLLGLLRDLGPDIVIATHSTEIITEAEPDEIVLINKKRPSARRLREPGEIEDVFLALGSNINPILTQLARSRRVVFVEGKDFQILSRFARRLGFGRVAIRGDFAVVPVEGFNPERIRSLKKGMETTLGTSVLAAAILDRDYRCESECGQITEECSSFCDLATILPCKEIENLLLVPSAITRAAERRLKERNARTGGDAIFSADVHAEIADWSRSKKTFVASRYLDNRRRFERSRSSSNSGSCPGTWCS